jgi:type I restriction enzyme, S subunit
MNAELLLAHFDRISDAPDAIPHLRQFIFKLAVRGKLINQNPSDDSASKLVECLQTEKMRQMMGTNKRQSSTPIDATVMPFVIPNHWVWLRLSDIGILSGGMTPSKARSEFWDGPINWFSPKDMKSDELFTSEMKITAKGARETGLQLYPPGCLFIVARSGILKRTLPVSINRVEATVNQDLKVLNPFVQGMERYLQIMFNGMSDFILSALVKTGTTVQSLKYEEFESQPIPLPPVDEQQRIVAKVDELIALCNQFQDTHREKQARLERLAAASHHQLNSGRNGDAFREHARFYLKHLQTITSQPEQIQQLRQTILSLAIRGHLVRQNLSDEPAVEVLGRIRAEKERLKREGNVKKENPLPGVTKEEEPFSAPVGWAWVRLDSLTQLITKGSSPKWQGVEYVSRGDGVLFVTSENVGIYRLRKMDQPKYVEKKFNEIEPRSVLRYGDILMNLVGGSIGRTAVYDLHDGANINQAVALVRLVPNCSTHFTEYLLHYFNSPLAVHLMLASRVTTAQPNMSLTDVRQFPVPIPPLAEQRRIVAKVEELMTLCGELEGQLATSQTESYRLLESVLYHAIEDGAENWTMPLTHSA